MERLNVMSDLIIINMPFPTTTFAKKIIGSTTPNKWLHPDNRHLFLFTILGK